MSSLRRRLVVMAIYLSLVILCIYLAFDFKGAIDPNWTLGLIGLTLPWSLVSVIFAWALIHGAGLEFFAGMYLLFAGLNCVLFERLAKPSIKSNKPQS